MPIQSGDVKLLKSAVMADVTEGGGAPTGIVIADGVSNAIFPDVSEMDRASGKVALRKVFAAVQTDDADTYLGANVVLAVPPEDSGVSLVMTPANALFETRPTALTRFQNPASTFAGTVELAAPATLGTKNIQVTKTSVPLTPVTEVQTQVEITEPQEVLGDPLVGTEGSLDAFPTISSTSLAVLVVPNGEAQQRVPLPVGARTDTGVTGYYHYVSVYLPAWGGRQDVQIQTHSTSSSGGAYVSLLIDRGTNELLIVYPTAERPTIDSRVVCTFAMDSAVQTKNSLHLWAPSTYEDEFRFFARGTLNTKLGPWTKPRGGFGTYTTAAVTHPFDGGYSNVATFNVYPGGLIWADFSTPIDLAEGPPTVARVTYPNATTIQVGTGQFQTVTTYTKVDSSVTGFNGASFPANGEATIFTTNRFVVVADVAEINQTVANSDVVNCGRVRLSSVRVIGNDGIVINTGYTADLEAGTVTFTNVAGYSQPVTIQHRVEDLAIINSIAGTTLNLSRGLSHAYPAGAKVSSALVAGDMFARTSLVFDQASWDGTTFSDTPGAEATGTFNDTTYPIVVTNRGAITEKWVARFTNSTSFEILGENVGLIATGNTASDCAPVNPNTGVPYFTIPALGWGSGWATGNVLRFNTIGSIYPFWVARSVQPGDPEVAEDAFTLLVRGDVDTP